jgi:hypothetical protein
MAAQTTNQFSGAFKADTQKELQTHAGDAPRASRQGLPGNIAGIARLSKLDFKQYGPDTTQKKADGSSAAGEWFFRAEGVCVTPDDVVTKNGKEKIAGQHTSPMAIPLCDVRTRKGELRTEWQQVRRVMDELVLLADNHFLFCDQQTKQPKAITRDLLRQTADSLVAESLRRSQAASGKGGIFFKYDTTQSAPSKQFPEPTVFENWRGAKGLANYVPPDFAAGAVQDTNTADGAPPAQQPAPINQPPYQSSPAAPPTQVETPAPPVAKPTVEEVDRLLRLATGDATLPETAPAQHELSRLSKANGWSEQEIEDVPSFEGLAAMAKGPKAAAPQGVHANGAPKKDDTWNYLKAPVVDPDTLVPIPGQFRTVLAQVTAVNGDGTFDLMNLKSRKAYTGVSLADLQPA